MGSVVWETVAAEVLNSLAATRDSEGDMKARLADIQRQKAQLEAAAERVEFVRSGKFDLGRLCPRCFLFHDKKIELTPIPSESENDLFRCRECDEEVEIET